MPRRGTDLFSEPGPPSALDVPDDLPVPPPRRSPRHRRTLSPFAAADEEALELRHARSRVLIWVALGVGILVTVAAAVLLGL